ncbi:MAG: hypothetical protein TECD_01157 [Hyphomicrobiaceae bacterium hypho_1]
MSNLRILILSDGRAGHFHLSEGIAAALNRDQDVDIKKLHVGYKNYPGLVVAMMTRSLLSPKRILKTVYGLETNFLANVDLVISAGSQTLGANICISRVLNVKNIFYGSLRQYSPRDFTLVLTSYQRQTKRAPNIIQTLKPSALDPDMLSDTTGCNTLGMIIGGPSRGINFSHNDWNILSSMITEANMVLGIRWIISNSPRTSTKCSEILRDLARQANGPISEFIDVENPKSKALPYLFEKVSGVICTADSSSMISEAVWARKPVIVIEPSAYELTKNEQDYREWLMESGWTVTLKTTELKSTNLPCLLDNLTPITYNPLDNLASLLKEKMSPV